MQYKVLSIEILEIIIIQVLKIEVDLNLSRLFKVCTKLLIYNKQKEELLRI